MVKSLIQLAAVLGSVLILMPAAGSAASGTGKASGADLAAACRTDDGPPAGTSMKKNPAGYAESEEWIANPDAQKAMGAIAASNDKAFGKDTKENSGITLANGYIGTTFDNRSKSVVVVVDPRVVSLDAVRDRLESVVSNARLANTDAPRLSVTVKPSCYSAKHLLGIQAALLAGTWKSPQDHPNYTIDLDPRDSTFHVAVANRPDLEQKLKDRFGPAVTPLRGEFRRMSR
jgi:hypothetical protein